MSGLGPPTQAFAPNYLPLDEAHEPRPFESYGLSKLLGEQAGAETKRPM